MFTGAFPFPFRLHPHVAGIVARVLALLLAGFLGGCKERVKPPTEAADEFAKRVSAQKFAEAYEHASASFKFTRSAKYFEARARDLGLGGASVVEWGAPEPRDRLTRIRGVFTRSDGTTLPLNLSLILEDGEWRLHEASSDPSANGVVDDVFAVASRTRDTTSLKALQFLEPSSLMIPEERELRALVDDTLVKFNEAILNGGDFTALYEAASDRWKFRGREPGELAYGGANPFNSKQVDPFNNENRLTVAALRNAFSAAIQAKVDLSPTQGAKMTLTEPVRINSDGVLNLKGAFDCDVFQAGQPTKPNRVQFALEYVMEASKWKLFGITVHILREEKPPDQ
jgi:hypothetical protein